MLNSLCVCVCVCFVFKCKWDDSNIGVWTNDFGFTLVDRKKLAYQNKPFIMVEQAKEVFYVQDPCGERWSVVLHRKTIDVNLEDDDSTLDTYHTPFSTHMPNVNREEEVNDVHANQNDHDVG